MSSLLNFGFGFVFGQFCLEVFAMTPWGCRIEGYSDSLVPGRWITGIVFLLVLANV